MIMKIDINNLTEYQEDYRIEAKAAKNQIPNSIWETYSSFANPGDMRPGLKTALSGGTSDARNATIMKMFGLLDFGERAGSGIPDLFDICKSELDTQPEYQVTYAPSRTTLTIDISKMIQTGRTIKKKWTIMAERTMSGR